MYLREMGHIVFEFATDGPGFTIDEDLDSLGTHLMLPEQYEVHREEIVSKLPPFNL